MSEVQDPQYEPQLVRSNLLLNADRFVLERDIMTQLEAGAGPLGMMMIDLEQKKREVCKIEGSKNIPKHHDMLGKLAFDGVYVDDPEVNQKFNDINVQKLEERLLNNNMSNFFRMNGELKLDNDILCDQVTRPADFAFEQTTAFRTKEVSAEMSDRMNSLKKKYYRLDVSVGKLELRHCEDLFSEEDLLCLEMKDQYNDYENQVSLAMIPFYMQRRDHLRNEINLEQGKVVPNQDDLTFLLKTLNDVQNSLDKEKQEVQRKAQALYDTWRKITEMREKNQYTQSYAHLKVYKKEIGGQTEYSFSFINQNPSEEKNDGSALPAEVRNRRETIKKVRVFAKLFINGKYVSETKKVPLTKSYFVAELCEVFQVNLFTMPSSIQLELYLSRGFGTFDRLVDVIDVEVPGQHVKTLTCACQLIQELHFSKSAHDKLGVKEKPLEELTDREKEDRKRKEEEATRSEIKGTLYVKTLWQGNGPNMPPIKSENLFKKQKAEKNRNKYSLEEEFQILLKQLYIDVNDPRNERIIKIIKEQHNEFFVKLLSDDAKNMLFDSKPFRHKLLLLRQRDAELAQLPIPLYESEIVDSTRTFYYLEKLEKLFRDEAYLVHLQARIENQDHAPDPNQLQITDLETIRRRQLILDEIKNRQQVNAIQNRTVIPYTSVVDEFKFDESNLFDTLFNYFSLRSRKLKPIVKKQTAVGIESVSESKLLVHVIKGQNVPLRRDFINMYQQFLGNKGNFQQQNQIARRQAGAGQSVEDRGQDKEFTQKYDVYKNAQVESYVEIKFVQDGQTVIDRTWCDEGKDPNWNEIKTFLFKSKGEKFTKQQLQDDQTLVVISLFDRQQYSQVYDGKLVTQEEHRFIGSIEIPMKTVLQNPGKIDCSFKLERPIVLPSYNVVNDEVYFIDNESSLDEKVLRKNEQVPTYISLQISLDPPLELPSENELAYYSGYESNALLTEGSKWVSENVRKHKNSRLCLFGENLKGQSVLLCRFLTPIKPPVEVAKVNDSFAIERAARFVSMIPFKDDISMFKNLADEYCTCQQFLDLGAGDYEEHAILLANYFQYIDDSQDPGKYQSYIVYGNAMPEGNTCYVMRQRSLAEAARINDYSVELWQPLTGECYFFREQKNSNSGICSFNPPNYLETRINDPVCPLRSIHCIVSSTNVWMNNQSHDSPIMLDFNLGNQDIWKPFFDSSREIGKFFNGGKIPTYQVLKGVDDLEYAKPMQNIENLESRVQKYIAEMFQDERIKTVRKTTKWKFDVQTPLRIILLNCEQQASMARSGGREGFNKIAQGVNTEIDLEQISNRMNALAKEQERDKRVWGFPINCTFTSLDNLWREVEKTKVYMVNRHDVEFGLSVFIQPYPANVLSVWVYLAAFVDKSLSELTQI